MRAKRGNPVAVRIFGSGKPTVRNAQLPGGNRMTKKLTPAAETQREPSVVLIGALLLMTVDQPAGYRLRGLARKGADVVR